MTIIFKLP